MPGPEQAGFLLTCVFRFFQLNFSALMWVFAQYPFSWGALRCKGALQLSGGGGLCWAAGTLGGAVATGRESVPSESVLLIQALARALGGNPKNTSHRLVPRL